jgi:sporulation protein YqfD
MSAFTWQIQVFGTENLSNIDIINMLKQNNIKVGKINLISSEEIETILLNNYDRIAQVSVIKEGTSIIINLSEKLVYVEETFEPITAKASGIITNINIITGTTNVKVGDYVNKGDILVLPFNINADGQKVSVKPIAEINAKMFIVGKSELYKQETKLVKTGKTKKTYKYKFKNLNLFSSKSKNSFALFETVVYNESVSGLVPLIREVSVFYELKPIQVENNLAEKKVEVERNSLNLAIKSLLAGEILEENTFSHLSEDKLISISTITLLGIIND